MELPQVEEALRRLYNNNPEHLPRELLMLSQEEWMALSQLLHNLLQEKAHSRVH
jgi:hypothetical protein